MPKLTQFTFVEIFDERKGAGQAQVSIGKGKLPLKETVAVISHVTGLYCAEMRMLLTEFKQYRIIGEDLTEEVKGCGEPYVKAVREISVTNSVRDLPELADKWHNLVHDAVADLWPELNESEEEVDNTTITMRGSSAVMTGEQVAIAAKMTKSQLRAAIKGEVPA